MSSKWLVTVGCAFLCVLATSSVAAAQGTAKLESLIAENGYYVEQAEEAPGLYVVWPAREIGEPAAVSVREVSGREVVYLWAWVLAVPDGFRHPPAMLQKMLELNDRLLVGSLSIAEDGSIAFNSSFWLEPATADEMRAEIAGVNSIVPALRAELSPYLDF